MDKKIISVISFVMALMLAFGVMAFAAEDVKKTAELSFESVEAVAGETIDVKINFKTTEAAGVVALGPITFDSNVLELVGFTYDASVTSLINSGLSGFDFETNAVVTLFNEDNAYDVCLGTLQFNVKEGATAGEVKINGIPSVMTTEGKIIASRVVAGKIAVAEESDAPELSASDRAKDSILLKINTNLAMAFGEMAEIDNTNSSVVPYIVNGRTLVPLRFVSETLGAEVIWEDGWNYCIVKKNEKEIKITFDSADIEVGGEVITYDAPIQVVENRTMVPIRFISETLGYDVYWNEPNQIVAITPMDNPWVKDRDAELSTINSMMVTLLLKRKL